MESDAKKPNVKAITKRSAEEKETQHSLNLPSNSPTATSSGNIKELKPQASHAQLTANFPISNDWTGNSEAGSKTTSPSSSPSRSYAGHYPSLYTHSKSDTAPLDAPISGKYRKPHTPSERQSRARHREPKYPSAIRVSGLSEEPRFYTSRASSEDSHFNIGAYDKFSAKPRSSSVSTKSALSSLSRTITEQHDQRFTHACSLPCTKSSLESTLHDGTNQSFSHPFNERKLSLKPLCGPKENGSRMTPRTAQLPNDYLKIFENKSSWLLSTAPRTMRSSFLSLASARFSIRANSLPRGSTSLFLPMQQISCPSRCSHTLSQSSFFSICSGGLFGIDSASFHSAHSHFEHTRSSLLSNAGFDLTNSNNSEVLARPERCLYPSYQIIPSISTGGHSLPSNTSSSSDCASFYSVSSRLENSHGQSHLEQDRATSAQDTKQVTLLDNLQLVKAKAPMPSNDSNTSELYTESSEFIAIEVEQSINDVSISVELPVEFQEGTDDVVEMVSTHPVSSANGATIEDLSNKDFQIVKLSKSHLTDYEEFREVHSYATAIIEENPSMQYNVTDTSQDVIVAQADYLNNLPRRSNEQFIVTLEAITTENQNSRKLQPVSPFESKPAFPRTPETELETLILRVRGNKSNDEDDDKNRNEQLPDRSDEPRRFHRSRLSKDERRELRRSFLPRYSVQVAMVDKLRTPNETRKEKFKAIFFYMIYSPECSLKMLALICLIVSFLLIICTSECPTALPWTSKCLPALDIISIVFIVIFQIYVAIWIWDGHLRRALCVDYAFSMVDFALLLIIPLMTLFQCDKPFYFYACILSIIAGVLVQFGAIILVIKYQTPEQREEERRQTIRPSELWGLKGFKGTRK